MALTNVPSHTLPDNLPSPPTSATPLQRLEPFPRKAAPSSSEIPYPADRSPPTAENRTAVNQPPHAPWGLHPPPCHSRHPPAHLPHHPTPPPTHRSSLLARSPGKASPNNHSSPPQDIFHAHPESHSPLMQ